MRVESLIYDLPPSPTPANSHVLYNSFHPYSKFPLSWRKTFPYVPSNAYNSPVGIPQSIVTSTDNSPWVHFVIFNAIRLFVDVQYHPRSDNLGKGFEKTRHSRRFVVKEKFSGNWILTGEISLNDLSLFLSLLWRGRGKCSSARNSSYHNLKDSRPVKRLRVTLCPLCTLLLPPTLSGLRNRWR